MKPLCGTVILFASLILCVVSFWKSESPKKVQADSGTPVMELVCKTPSGSHVYRYITKDKEYIYVYSNGGISVTK
jgi:hypothetical protein